MRKRKLGCPKLGSFAASDLGSVCKNWLARHIRIASTWFPDKIEGRERPDKNINVCTDSRDPTHRRFFFIHIYIYTYVLFTPPARVWHTHPIGPTKLWSHRSVRSRQRLALEQLHLQLLRRALDISAENSFFHPLRKARRFEKTPLGFKPLLKQWGLI